MTTDLRSVSTFDTSYVVDPYSPSIKKIPRTLIFLANDIWSFDTGKTGHDKMVISNATFPA